MWWVWRWLLNGADPRVHREGKVTQPPDLDAASGSSNVYSYFYLFLSLLKNEPKSYWKKQHMVPSHVTLRPLIQFFLIFPSEFYRLFWVRFRIPSESFKRLDCFTCCYNVSKQARETLHLYHINFRWPQSIYKLSILLVWRFFPGARSQSPLPLTVLSYSTPLNHSFYWCLLFSVLLSGIFIID